MSVWRDVGFDLTLLRWRNTDGGTPVDTLVYLEQRSGFSAANIKQLPGFDELTAAFTAYLDTPSSLPATVTLESSAPYQLRGASGNLKLVPNIDTSLDVEKEVLGERISLAWFSSQGR